MKMMKNESTYNQNDNVIGSFKDAFNITYDATDNFDKSVDSINNGIVQAQEILTEIIKTGNSLTVNCPGTFRYAVLPDTSTEIFQLPQCLLELAQYVDEKHKADGKWLNLSAKPFLLGAEKLQTKTIIFVGLDITQRNRISRLMRDTAENIGAGMKFDHADSSVEIHQDDMKRFLISLHEALS